MPLSGDKTNKEYEFVITPDIARLASSNSFIPYFSFGENLKEVSDLRTYKINASFKISKDFSTNFTKNVKKFHFFWGHENGEEIYYERPTRLPGITAKMRVRNLMQNPSIEVNAQYFKYIRFKIDSLYPPGVHLTDIMSVNLLERRYCPLHCAAVSKDNEASLLIAPPDTGKSLTTFLAIKEGLKYIAEDIAFIDAKHVYSNPNTSTFLHNAKYTNYNLNRVSSFFCKNIPLLSYYTKPKISAHSLWDISNKTEKTVVKRIFILERGTQGTQKIDSLDAVRRILTINRNEFSYSKNSLLFAYSYLNPSVDINRLMKNEEDIIRELVGKSICHVLMGNEPTDYIRHVLKLMV